MKYIGSALLVFAVVWGGWYLSQSMSSPPTTTVPQPEATDTQTTSNQSDTSSQGQRSDDDDEDEDDDDQSNNSSCNNLNDLKRGSRGADVVCLQNFLISHGYAIPAGATGYFGPQTEAAQAAWHKDTGIQDTVITEPSAPSYTLADIATHVGRTSCWSAINGVVYDLTSWIDKHPGGSQRILSICGKDGSSAFSTQHAGEPKPEQMLATFKIGALK